MLKKILNPDLYHGERKKKNYFEGWYYKIQDKDNKYVLAFIPGIIKGHIVEEGESFIQVLNGNNKPLYLKFTKDSFKFQHKPFCIKINHNHFSLKEISLNHYDENIQLVGTLRIVDGIKWPDSIFNPGSMGFYNYLIFMECYSQVCCLTGNLIGKLMVNDEEIDFTGGKVYIEKNWGSRFPESYVWVQANNFLNEEVAVSVSLGRVPLWFYHFNGFLTAFVLNGKVYKFTSINRSKMNISFNKNNVVLTFEKDDYQLNIETRCHLDDFVIIKGPIHGKMARDIKESIISDVRVELIDLYRERILFQGVSNNGGVEIMGDTCSLKR